MKKSFERFYPLFVFLFACLLYVNTIPNEYNLDDELVTRNHRTTSKGFKGVSEIINSYYYEDEMGYKYGYRPVTHISFAIEHQIFGENPHISHAINVLLYALLCLTIYFLTQKLAPDKGAFLALIVALIFAVHPLHTEVVASIKNRDEILSLLFMVCSLKIALFAKGRVGWKSETFYWLLALSCFVSGLLAKQSIVVSAFLIPMATLWFVNRKRVVLPILFFILGASVFVYLNEISLMISIGFVSIVTGIILVFNFFSDFNFLKFKHQIETNEAIKYRANLFFFIVLCLSFTSAIYSELVWLNMFAICFAFLLIFFTKNDKAIFRISLLLFSFLVLQGFCKNDERLILLGFFTLVFLHQKLLYKKKHWLILAAVIASIATLVQYDFTFKYDGFVFLYIIVIAAQFYYKPLWYTVPLLV